MSPNRDPIDPVSDEMHITRDRAMVESVYKFKFFFVGLVFAILSFSMQFPVKTEIIIIRTTEIISWLLLLVTGYFAIKDCGGFN